MLRRITACGSSERKNWKMLDMCTGTGCIPALVCKEWSTSLFGGISAHAIDISEDSTSLTSVNAANALIGTGADDARSLDTWRMDIFGEDFIKWLEIHGPFDIVTFNPPYIPRSDWETLPVSVKEYEDPTALIGGEDGLKFYHHIAWLLEHTPLLHPGAWVTIEFGQGQAQAVKEIMGATGRLGKLEVWTDAFGVERALFCRAAS
ncbi:hypothetical protein FRC20_007041 [Serendipita sp. 405]|nr:hypothetical protein FRC20_007041 [Serendipita sp. 405]